MKVLYYLIGIAQRVILHDVLEPYYFSMLVVGKHFAFHPNVHPSLTTGKSRS